MKRKIAVFFFLLLFLLSTPLVSAENDEGCGLNNLSECFTTAFYDFFVDLINLPLQPLLSFIEKLLTSEVHIDIFENVWKSVCYVLSFFYLFLFLYSGIVFLTSSENPIKRMNAKDSIKNLIIMIILIQASFLIYEVILSLSNILNSVLLNMIDDNFFKFTFDNLSNIALELTFGITYLLALLCTVFLLALRYIMVMLGVVLFPIGIFFYYVPSLRSYGRFLIRMLANFIFVSVIDLLIVLACSLIITDPLFANFKIVVMIVCLIMINYSIFWCVKFAMSRIDVSGIKDDVGQAVKYMALAV